jgi:hypothetical protein
VVPFTYPSGEIVQRGDQIRYAGEEGVVEFVADPDVVDPATAWYVEKFGGGCMIVTQKFGSIFLDATVDQEDLEFVARVKG